MVEINKVRANIKVFDNVYHGLGWNKQPYQV